MGTLIILTETDMTFHPWKVSIFLGKETVIVEPGTLLWYIQTTSWHR